MCYGQRLEVAEGLREINLNLEKRIDILIGLLVISASPTKLDLLFPFFLCHGHPSRYILPQGAFITWRHTALVKHWCGGGCFRIPGLSTSTPIWLLSQEDQAWRILLRKPLGLRIHLEHRIHQIPHQRFIKNQHPSISWARFLGYWPH